MKRRLATGVAGARLSGKTAQVRHQEPAEVPGESSSNRIQEAAHVSGSGHQQVSGPSAALDSATAESVVNVENSGHGPEKVSQQQGSVSFGTTNNGCTSAPVEESLSVDPIVTGQLASGYVFDDILSSVNSVSLKRGLVAGEDVNRAASQNTEIRVPEQSSFVHAASVFSRDLMDLSVRVDERSFQHDFGDLDTSRASGLDTPSEYLPGESAASVPPPFFSSEASEQAGKMPEHNPAVNNNKPGQVSAEPGRQEPPGTQPLGQDIPVQEPVLPEDALQKSALQGDKEAGSQRPAGNGPVLSEYQRYLQKQKYFEEKKQQGQQSELPAAEPANKMAVDKESGRLEPQIPANSASVSLQDRLQDKLQDRGKPEETAGEAQALAAFNALSALAKQTAPGEHKVQKVPDNSVHIGRIDVMVTADEAVKKSVTEQPPSSGTGWASRHYLRRV
ncbi:hypothetical protein [Thalassomonas viridans]|nr:hypothetical protein [Thalassomonas viridans]